MADIWLLRHGETEWSVSRRHTGRTDISLTERGKQQAVQLGHRLQSHEFSLVLSSPLRRARETCSLAGFDARAVEDDDLMEWDYGECEGRTTAAIRKEKPGWDIWDAAAPGGESVEEVGARVDRALARATAATGDVAIFAHAHLLRIVAARWLALPPVSGRSFVLDTASVSRLSHERKSRVIALWNDVSHLRAQAPQAL